MMVGDNNSAISSKRSSRASSSKSSRRSSSNHSVESPSTSPANGSSLQQNGPLSPQRLDVNDSPGSSVTNRTNTAVSNSPVPPTSAIRKDGFQRAIHSNPPSRPDSATETAAPTSTHEGYTVTTTTTTTTTRSHNGEVTVTKDVKEDISTRSMPTDSCAFDDEGAGDEGKGRDASMLKPRPKLAPLSAAFSDDEAESTKPKAKPVLKQPVAPAGKFLASPPSATRVPLLKFSPHSPHVVSPRQKSNTARTPTTTTTNAASSRGHYSARVVSSVSSPYSSKGHSATTPTSTKTIASHPSKSVTSPRSKVHTRASVATVTEVQRHVSSANHSRQHFAVRHKQLLKKEAAGRNELQKKEKHEMVAVQRWRDVSLAYVKQVGLGIISRTALAGPLPLNLLEGSTSSMLLSPKGTIGGGSSSTTNYTAIKRGNHAMLGSPNMAIVMKRMGKDKEKETKDTPSNQSGSPARNNSASVSMASQSAVADRNDMTFSSYSKNEENTNSAFSHSGENKMPLVKSITSPIQAATAIEETENSARDVIENEERKELRMLIVGLFVADMDPDWVAQEKRGAVSPAAKGGARPGASLTESLRPAVMKTLADRMLAIAAYEYYQHRKGRVAAVSLVMSIMQPELPPPRRRSLGEKSVAEEFKKAPVKPAAKTAAHSRVGIVARTKGVHSVAVTVGSPVHTNKLEPIASKNLKGGKIAMEPDTNRGSWVPLSTDESKETSVKAPASPKLSVIKKRNTMMMVATPQRVRLPSISTTPPPSVDKEQSDGSPGKPLPSISPNKPPRSSGSSVASTPSRSQLSPSLSMSLNGKRRESLAMRRRSEDDDLYEAMALAERAEIDAREKKQHGGKSPRPASKGGNSSRVGSSRMTGRSGSRPPSSRPSSQPSSRPSSRSSRPSSASPRPSSRPSSSRPPSSRSAVRPPTTPAKPSTRESLNATSMDIPIETTVFVRGVDVVKQDDEEYYTSPKTKGSFLHGRM